MKKLKKLEKSFAALENKELSNLQSVFGGAMQTTKCSVPTSGSGGWTDTEHWEDDKHVGTAHYGPLE